MPYNVDISGEYVASIFRVKSKPSKKEDAG
jgi:hypothetical protein